VTLILSNLSRGFASQVSDRLVTRTRPGSDPVPFDALANKTVIYWARDAIVTMSYTGPAYIGELTTDDWIVQKLTGLNVTGGFGTRLGALPQWLDIGQAARVLAEEFSRSEIGRSQVQFALVIAGWQWKNVRRPLEGRYQPVPMGWALSNTPELGVFEKKVERLPRHWQWRNRTFFHAAPKANFASSERTKMFAQLREEISNDPPKTNIEMADRVERVTVDAIRSASVTNRYVGANCMSVVIAPPHQQALVRVTFFPYDDHTARLVGENLAPMVFPAAYSPWIIGRGLMQKPPVIIGRGGWDLPMGPFTVKLSGPDGPTEGLLAGMSSQQRPPRPRR